MKLFFLLLFFISISCTPTNVYLMPQSTRPTPKSMTLDDLFDTTDRVVAENVITTNVITTAHSKKDSKKDSKKVIEIKPIADNSELFADELEDIQFADPNFPICADDNNQINLQAGIYLLQPLPQGIYQFNMYGDSARVIIPEVGAQPLILTDERTMIVVNNNRYKKWEPKK